MTKFCPECGNSIVEPNLPFCPRCGAKLPITSPEVKPSPLPQPTVQQPVHPSYNTPPVSTVPPTSTVSKNSERSFYYSNKFYVVIILDLLISSLFTAYCIYLLFTPSNPQYNNPFTLYFGILCPLNLILSIVLLNNMRKSPHSIDANLCWFKCVFGFLGIITLISGLYFLIISIKMQRAYS